MLHIHVLPLGDYQTNCYILHNDGSSDCVVLDPGYEPEIILSYLAEKKLNLTAIALTHCHFDHVGAVKELAAQTDCRVYLNQKDLALPPMLTNGPLYYTDTYKDGDTVPLAGIPFRVLETPGHTPGSVCLMTGAHLFSGDTLFAGSCGRTDLPGGDSRAMRDSLRKLATLEGDYDIYPGHGSATTLAREKQTNPYL